MLLHHWMTQNVRRRPFPAPATIVKTYRSIIRCSDILFRLRLIVDNSGPSVSESAVKLLTTSEVKKEQSLLGRALLMAEQQREFPAGYTNVYMQPVEDHGTPATITGLDEALKVQRATRISMRKLAVKHNNRFLAPTTKPYEAKENPETMDYDHDPAVALWWAAMLVVEWSLGESAEDEVLVRDVYETLRPLVRASPISGTLGYRYASVRKTVLTSFSDAHDWVDELRAIDQ